MLGSLLALACCALVFGFAPGARAATVVRPAATTASETTPAAPPTITVTAVGDMSFDRPVKQLIAKRGSASPFRSVLSRLSAADVTVGNLECALSKRGSAVRGKKFTFRGPPAAAQGLATAGFDFVSMANNHARDWGGSALSDTFKALSTAGVSWAGAGSRKSAAWSPAYIDRNGARIAYLAFSEIGPGNFAATAHRSGTAYTGNSAAVARAIRAAHANADYVIVSFHWGVERSNSPTKRQIHDGRSAISAGADLVLSHHPHAIQGVEYYKRGLIAYSLGNFVFSPGTAAGHDTMILNATLSPAGVSAVSATPAHIRSDGTPAPATGSTARRILSLISKTSKRRGSHVSVSGSKATITP